jgi:hypothetical protein
MAKAIRKAAVKAKRKATSGITVQRLSTLELVRHLNCRLENICEDVGALGQVAKLREHLAVQCVANRRLLEEKASLGRRILDLQKEVAELKAAPVVRGERRRDLLEAARPFIAETDIAQQKPNGVAR